MSSATLQCEVATQACSPTNTLTFRILPKVHGFDFFLRDSIVLCDASTVDDYHRRNQVVSCHLNHHRTYLRQWQRCLSKASTWWTFLQEGTSCAVERKESKGKGHCGFLGASDNQNITLRSCSECFWFWFFYPSAGLPHPNHSKQCPARNST